MKISRRSAVFIMLNTINIPIIYSANDVIPNLKKTRLAIFSVMTSTPHCYTFITSIRHFTLFQPQNTSLQNTYRFESVTCRSDRCVFLTFQAVNVRYGM